MNTYPVERHAQIVVGFGDFQTPVALATRVLEFVRLRGVRPGRVLEPTCGAGSFIDAAYATWQADIREAIGIEINPVFETELNRLENGHAGFTYSYGDAQVLEGDQLHWKTDAPLLICGNLPWVTTDALSRLDDTYQQRIRDNPKSLKGLDALTGSASFDISERLALRMIAIAANEPRADVAILVKESVARRLLVFAHGSYADAAVVRIDSQRWFDVNVQACLLYLHFDRTCERAAGLVDYFSDFGETSSERWNIGNGVVRRSTERKFTSSKLAWRHGIKHDAASVFELRVDEIGWLRTVDGETVDVAPQSRYVFPFVTARSLHRDADVSRTEKRLFVPQNGLADRSIEADVAATVERDYLERSRDRLARRRSSIYTNKPNYAIFGVGAYTFTLFKVAVAGLYMAPRFRFLGPIDGRPCVLGDTSYFIPCDRPAEAALLCVLLEHETTLQQIGEMAFPGKRPITKRVLDALDVAAAWTTTSRSELISRAKHHIAAWDHAGRLMPDDEEFAGDVRTLEARLLA